ncbi:MAG: SDR family oxidoreductase [Acidimicrobiia bacterium]|nr:SDR family oxidoreductase [Acidimicrobiia bacterium]
MGPGVGRATALALATEGSDVVLAARSADVLASVAAEVEALGVRALAVPTDVGEVDQCRRLVAAAAGGMGRIDVVVNSAAAGGGGRIVDTEPEDWHTGFQVNVVGPVEISKAAVPHLRERGGAIVMVSTLAVRAINPRQGVYAVSKAALTVAAQTMARELGRDGIRVNVVVPGFVDGPGLTRTLEASAERRGITVGDAVGEITREVPLGRLPTSADIADAVVFLASDRARSITGQTLDVNGGRWFA